MIADHDWTRLKPVIATYCPYSWFFWPF